MTNDTRTESGLLDQIRNVEQLDEPAAERRMSWPAPPQRGVQPGDVFLPTSWPAGTAHLEALFDDPAERTRFAAVSRMVGRNARVLDIGAGHGLLATHLATHNGMHRYRGIDLRETALAAARKIADAADLGHLAFSVGDATKITREDVRDLDPTVILMLEILEHLDDPVTVLRAVAGFMPDDAEIIFSVPLLGRIETCWGHCTVFGADAIAELVELAGLHITDLVAVHNRWALVKAGRSSASDGDSPAQPQLLGRYTRQRPIEGFAHVAQVANERLPSAIYLEVPPGSSPLVTFDTPQTAGARIQIQVSGEPQALSEIVVRGRTGETTVAEWRISGRQTRSGNPRSFLLRPGWSTVAVEAVETDSPQRFDYLTFSAVTSAPLVFGVVRLDTLHLDPTVALPQVKSPRLRDRLTARIRR